MNEQMEKLRSRIFDRVIMPVVLALLVLQLIAAQTIWTLNTTGQNNEELFALFVAANLVSLSMISYLYRVEKRDDPVNKSSLYSGLFFLVILLLAAAIVGQLGTSPATRIPAYPTVVIIICFFAVAFAIGMFVIRPMSDMTGDLKDTLGKSNS
jgi:peptidoglycan/LPS O-acetylase OafA/YrhL